MTLKIVVYQKTSIEQPMGERVSYKPIPVENWFSEACSSNVTHVYVNAKSDYKGLYSIISKEIAHFDTMIEVVFIVNKISNERLIDTLIKKSKDDESY